MADRLDPTLRDPARFRHWTPVTLRFRDLDLLGHVNNVSVAGWLEDGRVALELPIQPLTPAFDGPVIVLADLHIQYLEEVRWGAEIKVGTRVQKLGKASAVIGQAVFADGRCAVTAEAVEVLIGPVSRKPEPWPAEFRALFEQHLEPG